MRILLVFLTLLLYFFAPEAYSLSFCWGCCIIYLFIVYLSIKQEIKDGTFFSFNILFWISLFCTTFIVPLFILPSGGLSLFYVYANKCTAMTVFAVSMYYLGWHKYYVGKRTCQISNENNIYINPSKLGVFNVLSIVITGFYLFQFLFFLRSSTIYDNDIGLGVTYTLVQAILCSSLIVSTVSKSSNAVHDIRHFFQGSSIILICYAIIILTSIFIGDRTMPIYLCVCIAASYIIYIRRIPILTQWLIILCCGAVMITIGKTRHSDDNFREGGLGSVASTTISTISSSEQVVDLFSDFLPASSALYLCADWRESNNGKLFYPLKILRLPFTPIPYAPSFISKALYGVNNEELSSATLTTNWYSNRVELLNGGLGTHVVADVYVSWGIIGIVIIFYLFGVLIGNSQRRNKENIYWAMVYIAFFCNALYIPRASIFDNFRAIAYELFLVWLIAKSTGNFVINKYGK